MFSIALTVIRSKAGAGPHQVGLRSRSMRLPGEIDADPIGPEGQPLVGGVGVEQRAVAVGGGVALERGSIEMCRQEAEVVDGVVAERELPIVHREGLSVHDIDPGDPPIELGIADPALRMPPDLPGEEHVVRAHRHAVAPGGPGLDRVGERHPFAAVLLRLDRGTPVLEGRQLGAEHAGELPPGVVGRERPLRQPMHVGLGRHRLDVRVEGRRELADADGETVAGGGDDRVRGQAGP